MSFQQIWIKVLKLILKSISFKTEKRIKDLESQIVVLTEDNLKLRDALKDNLIDSTYIKEVLFRNNELLLSYEGGAIQLIAEMLADQFKEVGAKNYVEMAFTSNSCLPGEHFVLTLQRMTGLTPHQKIILLEKENAELRTFNNWR